MVIWMIQSCTIELVMLLQSDVWRIRGISTFHSLGSRRKLSGAFQILTFFMVLEINFMGGVRACLGTLDLSNISMLPPFAMT